MTWVKSVYFFNVLVDNRIIHPGMLDAMPLDVAKWCASHKKVLLIQLFQPIFICLGVGKYTGPHPI
jgi:hypothetical protein